MAVRGLVATVVALISVTSAGAPANAQDDANTKKRVVLYRLKSDAKLKPIAEQLSDELVVHVGKLPGLVVLSESEIKVMLQHEKDKKVLMCEDDKRCLAKLEEAVQADKLITGHVGRMGPSYVVTLKLADAKRAVVERAEAAQADDPSELPAAVRAAAARLLGKDAADGRQRFRMKIAPEGTSAAVIDLQAHGVGDEVAANLTQLLSLELKKFEGLGVISRDEIKTMLRFQRDKMALTCKSDTSCLVEIGGALGVDYLITGSVGKLGEAYVISLKLMDIHGAKVANRASQSLRGSEADLPLALRFAAWELLGKQVDGRGQLSVRANVDAGEVVVGALKPTSYPMKSPLAGLPVGKVGVTLAADGYYPRFQETYVLSGQATTLKMDLQEVPTPWYEQWWPWTILGAVVVGATVTTVVLLDQGNASSGDVQVKVAPAK